MMMLEERVLVCIMVVDLSDDLKQMPSCFSMAEVM